MIEIGEKPECLIGKGIRTFTQRIDIPDDQIAYIQYTSDINIEAIPEKISVDQVFLENSEESRITITFEFFRSPNKGCFLSPIDKEKHGNSRKK